MTNAKAFGCTLARIRKEQGFPSAHQFYKSIGGAKSLGLAFVSYWDMERGKKLPKSWRLEEIMAALGVEQSSQKAQELVRAYFKSLSGSDKLLQNLSPLAAPAADLAEATTHKALEQIKVHLTMEQWKLCARDMATYICQYYLLTTAGWISLREFSDATGFKPEAIKKAVKALAAGGLAELSGDKARSLFDKKTVEVLPATPATAALKAALRNRLNTWLADSTRVDSKRIAARLTKASLDAYRQHLDKTINLAPVYANSEESKQDSAVYLIDASIFRIFPKAQRSPDPRLAQTVGRD